VGTLDSLMELNENLGKLDSALDSAVKKVEKQCKDLGREDLYVEQNNNKCKKRFIYPADKIEDYIKNFKWDDTKVPRKRALNDIAN